MSKKRKRNAEYFQNVNMAMKEKEEFWFPMVGSYEMPRMDTRLIEAQKRIWRKKSKGKK